MRREIAQQFTERPWYTSGSTLRVSRLTAPRVVLLGDAAHAVSAAFGQGVNSALEVGCWTFSMQPLTGCSVGKHSNEAATVQQHPAALRRSTAVCNAARECSGHVDLSGCKASCPCWKCFTASLQPDVAG